MWWFLLVLAIAIIAVYFFVFRSRFPNGAPSPNSENDRDVHDGMELPHRRAVLLFLVILGIGLIFMEISLLAVDFPDTVRLAGPQAFPTPLTVPTSQEEVQTLQAGSGTDGTTNGASQPATNGSAPATPTPVPHPVIEQVLQQSTGSTPPSMWLVVYGRNFSDKAKVRLNGRPAAMLQPLAPNLLAVQLPPSELVSVGTITVDVLDGDNRISNAMLVPVTNPKVPLNVFFLHYFFEWKPWINREVQLLLVVIFAGALGSYIHLLRSFNAFLGNGTLKASWFWFYITGPFVGAAMALVFYAVLRGGFLAGTPADEKVVNPFGVLAVGALVGMFSDKAGMKLKEVFETLFKSDDQRAGKLHAPVITSLDPNRILAGQGETLVTVIGERLRKVTVVRFNSTEKPAEVISDTKITFKLDAAELANPGVLKIAAVDPEAGTSVSAPLTIVAPEENGAGGGT